MKPMRLLPFVLLLALAPAASIAAPPKVEAAIVPPVYRKNNTLMQNAASMLSQLAVQDKLGLSKTTRTKISALYVRLEKDEILMNQRPDMNEQKEAAKEATTGNLALTLLSKEQRIRLRGFALQALEIDAFRSPDVAALLGLTPSTTKQINDLLDGYDNANDAYSEQLGQKLANLKDPVRPTTKELKEFQQKQQDIVAGLSDQKAKLDQLRKDTSSKIGDLLSPDQKSKLASLKGAPVKVADVG